MLHRPLAPQGYDPEADKAAEEWAERAYRIELEKREAKHQQFRAEREKQLVCPVVEWGRVDVTPAPPPPQPRCLPPPPLLPYACVRVGHPSTWDITALAA